MSYQAAGFMAVDGHAASGKWTARLLHLGKSVCKPLRHAAGDETFARKRGLPGRALPDEI